MKSLKRDELEICKLTEFATIIKDLGVKQKGNIILIWRKKFDNKIIYNIRYKGNSIILFKECVFEMNFCVNFIEENEISFERCDFQNIEIEGENLFLNFFKVQCEIFKCNALNSRVRINRGIINEINIGGSYNRYMLSMITINQFTIFDTNFDNPCNISLAHCRISNLTFRGNIENEIFFFLCRIKGIVFYYFINSGYLWFDRIIALEEDSYIYVQSSILEKVIFSNSNLKEYKFNIEASDISKSIINECGYLNCEEGINERDFYRQLKSSSKSSEDNVSYLYYRSKELDEYHNEIKKTQKWCSNDRIILFLSKWSNYYGFRWDIALIFILSAGIIFFLFSILTLDKWPIKFGWISYNHAMDSLAIVSEKFFDFLNPTHSLKIFNEYSTSPFTYLWDMLGRIFIGFGIYQLIKAFRKFVL